MPLKGLTPGSFASFPSPKPISSGSGSIIKSVQSGTGTMATSTTLNIAIASVDTTKSVISVYCSQGGNSTGNLLAQGTLTTSTNLQISTLGTSTSAFEWQIIEFQNLKSFQSGNFSAISTTVTISPVNVSKSMLFFNFKSTASSSTLTDSFMAGYISASTSVAFNAIGASAMNVNWYVVESN